VRGFQLGDRVADLTVVGSNAAYRTLRADRLTRVPAGLDAAEAATLILSRTTAYQLLHRAAQLEPLAPSVRRRSPSAGCPASGWAALPRLIFEKFQPIGRSAQNHQPPETAVAPPTAVNLANRALLSSKAIE
jgi:hypothetical protein